MAQKNKTVARTTKRDSAEVDKLMARVAQLVAGGMSVNAACADVGVQTTVYYFRKRKEAALALQAAQSSPVTTSYTPGNFASVPVSTHKDINALTQEARELENRLNSIKLQIAEKLMSNQKHER